MIKPGQLWMAEHDLYSVSQGQSFPFLFIKKVTDTEVHYYDHTDLKPPFEPRRMDRSEFLRKYREVIFGPGPDSNQDLK